MDLSSKPPSDPWSLASGRLCQISRGFGEAGAGDVVVDVLVDGPERGAQGRWCLGLVGGEQRAQQPVVQLGVEDRAADAVGGQDVAVGPLDPGDDPGKAESAQVVGGLAGV